MILPNTGNKNPSLGNSVFQSIESHTFPLNLCLLLTSLHSTVNGTGIIELYELSIRVVTVTKCDDTATDIIILNCAPACGQL